MLSNLKYDYKNFFQVVKIFFRRKFLEKNFQLSGKGERGFCHKKYSFITFSSFSNDDKKISVMLEKCKFSVLSTNFHNSANNKWYIYVIYTHFNYDPSSPGWLCIHISNKIIRTTLSNHKILRIIRWNKDINYLLFVHKLKSFIHK